MDWLGPPSSLACPVCLLDRGALLLAPRRLLVWYGRDWAPGLEYPALLRSPVVVELHAIYLVQGLASGQAPLNQVPCHRQLPLSDPVSGPGWHEHHRGAVAVIA